MHPSLIGRGVAILIGILITTSLSYGLGYSSYISFPAGILGYLFTRYALWAIRENKRIKLEMNELVEKARRGEPLS